MIPQSSVQQQPAIQQIPPKVLDTPAPNTVKQPEFYHYNFDYNQKQTTPIQPIVQQQQHQYNYDQKSTPTQATQPNIGVQVNKPRQAIPVKQEQQPQPQIYNYNYENNQKTQATSTQATGISTAQPQIHQFTQQQDKHIVKHENKIYSDPTKHTNLNPVNANYTL